MRRRLVGWALVALGTCAIVAGVLVFTETAACGNHDTVDGGSDFCAGPLVSNGQAAGLALVAAGALGATVGTLVLRAVSPPGPSA